MKYPSAWVVAVLLPAVLAAQAPQLDAGAESIRVADLKAHIGFLASDELQGRAAGTEHNDIASQYVAAQFERIGLVRVCDDGKSWFQPFRAGRAVQTRNVIGLLEGRDKALNKEIIVIGAHFDHVGLGKFGSRGGATEDDKIHNGADDNASGTAGIIELAEAFALAPPKRSLLFIAFSAEELGLLGSFHYVRRPVLPIAKTVAMLNFDMIGRSKDDYLFLGGTGTSPAWADLIDKHFVSAGFALEQGAGGLAPSDSTHFYRKRMPVLFFFTNVHEDYHRATDHAEYVNYEGEQRILRAAYALTRQVADMAEAPAFAKSNGMAMPADFMELMQKPGRRRDLAGQLRDRSKQGEKEPRPKKKGDGN